MRFSRAFERGFEGLREGYHVLLHVVVRRRPCSSRVFLGLCSGVPPRAVARPGFLSDTDNGQFILHLRAKTGTRIEETAKLCDLVEGTIRSEIPEHEVDNILDNIGLPYSTINLMHSTSGLMEQADADILVSLKEKHHPTANYVQRLAGELPREFPGTTFYFLPSDIVTQVLNFGLPAPVDIQIEGTDIDGNREVAAQMLHKIEHVPGITDARIQQAFDYPEFDVTWTVPRRLRVATRSAMLPTAAELAQRQPPDHADVFLNVRTVSTTTWSTQTPQYSIQSLDDLQNTPLNTAGATRPEILADVASINGRTKWQWSTTTTFGAWSIFMPPSRGAISAALAVMSRALWMPIANPCRAAAS